MMKFVCAETDFVRAVDDGQLDFTDHLLEKSSIFSNLLMLEGLIVLFNYWMICVCVYVDIIVCRMLLWPVSVETDYVRHVDGGQLDFD